MCIHVWACICHDSHVKVRAQLMGVSSLLPPCLSWGSNSGHQPWRWRQAPLPTVPFNSPTLFLIFKDLTVTSKYVKIKFLNVWLKAIKYWIMKDQWLGDSHRKPWKLEHKKKKNKQKVKSLARKKELKQWTQRSQSA